MEETQPSGGGGAGDGTRGGRASRGRWYDPTPLLRPHRAPPRAAAASWAVPFTRRLMRSPYMAVRETAALQLEERHTDWGYSRPVVALDLIWSLAFVLVSCAVLLATVRERPSTPVRVWILGYALHCLVHVAFVCFEYRRRQRSGATGRDRWVGVEDGEEEEEEESGESRRSRVLKKLESANAIVSFFWWMLGFYWIVVGGQTLLQDAPRLYWLAVVFLAFDVFFAIFCILLACIIGVALCCCLPCIIAILYAVTGQEGASDDDLSSLPRFRFCESDRPEVFHMDGDHRLAVHLTEQNCNTMNDLSQHRLAVNLTELNCNTISDPSQPRLAVNLTEQNCNITSDLSLSPEDSDCCICLSRYEDGVELCSLPCNHYFHSACIVKWLRINATCPLCKCSILKGDEQV